ncbi:hypothetical protein [Clostridium lundense]|uniref:hypothetical protein n=1 Tax=Clostridium lundense TaxID=319475 RepID=UPI0012EC4382|nr:hypothetical protein [Clostridium lundense]
MKKILSKNIKDVISLEEDLITYEALEWLINNNNPSALASDRFGETINAIKFVEKLYELGAVKVSVVGIWDEQERIEKEGGSYASTLLVQLPNDTKKRERILDVYNKEIEESSLNDGEEFEGWNENILAFWWD